MWPFTAKYKSLRHGPHLDGQNLFERCQGPLVAAAFRHPDRRRRGSELAAVGGWCLYHVDDSWLFPFALASLSGVAWRCNLHRSRDFSCCYLLYPLLCWLVCILTFFLLPHLLIWPWNSMKVSIFCFISSLCAQNLISYW